MSCEEVKGVKLMFYSLICTCFVITVIFMYVYLNRHLELCGKHIIINLNSYIEVIKCVYTYIRL